MIVLIIQAIWGLFQENVDTFLLIYDCAQLTPRYLQIYTGAGITQSDPDKEWEEICRKANTFLSVV